MVPGIGHVSPASNRARDLASAESTAAIAKVELIIVDECYFMERQLAELIALVRRERRIDRFFGSTAKFSEEARVVAAMKREQKLASVEEIKRLAREPIRMPTDAELRRDFRRARSSPPPRYSFYQGGF